MSSHYKKKSVYLKKITCNYVYVYVDGLVQACSNSSAIAMELLQSCLKPLIWSIISNQGPGGHFKKA